MRLSILGFVVSTLVASGGVAAQAPPAPEVPAEMATVLAAHLGKWQSEGTLAVSGVSQPARATWECLPAAGGKGIVCTWQHEWSDGSTDRALEILGYDPILGMLSGARVTDRGIVTTWTGTVRGNALVVQWESTQGGSRVVGVNEVFTSDGDWTQRMTIDMDGRRVTEMNVTHHRVR